jgi:hypothetical protein
MAFKLKLGNITGKNNRQASKLIKELVARGVTRLKISKEVGMGPSWASEVVTKGTAVNPNRLKQLRFLTEEYNKWDIPAREPEKNNVTAEAFILSMFKSTTTIMHKGAIMRKCLSNKMTVGKTENTLYDMKENGKLECPKRGYYKLPACKLVSKPKVSNNGNGSISPSALKRLIKDVRFIKRHIKETTK